MTGEKPENTASLHEDIVSLRSLFQDIANHTGLLLPYDNGLCMFSTRTDLITIIHAITHYSSSYFSTLFW
jgi:hypothetical protein